MTTYQDQPLSRRAVREQHERESAQAAVVPSAAPAPVPAPVAPEAPPAPLPYTTQGRIPVPDYDGPSLRARRMPDPAVPPEGATTAPEGSFRPRDFSPEGRRSASPTWAPQYGGAPLADAPAGAAPAGAAPAAPAAPPEDEPVEHTLTRRELRALRDAHGITAETTGETAYPTPAPPAAAPAAPVTPESTLTTSDPVTPAATLATSDPVTPAATLITSDPGTPPATLTTSDPGTPLAAPSTRLDSALAEFDQLTGRTPQTDPVHGRRAAAPAQPEPVPLVDPPAPTPAAATPPPASAYVPPPVADPAPAAEPVAPAIPVAEPAPVAPPQAAPQQVAPQPEAPQQQAPAQPAPEVVVAELVTPAPAPAAPSEPVIEATVVASEPTPASAEPPTSTPPTGHWTTQAQLDDETQFGEAALSRNIGATSGAITTSALVLPSIPDHDFGPLATGDIMVTGSISLPASLAATGAHPAQLDEHDLDHLLDPGDHQVASTDSQPVRAIKAVSGHTSSGGVIQNVKPKGTKGLTALIIAATSMAVVVGALFIVLVVTGQL